MIQKEDIEKLAALARLNPSPLQMDALTRDIESILAYVSQIEQEEAASGTSVPPLRNVMREDGEPHPAGAHTEALLAEAPKREGDYVVVKPILSRDS